MQWCLAVSWPCFRRCFAVSAKAVVSSTSLAVLSPFGPIKWSFALFWQLKAREQWSLGLFWPLCVLHGPMQWFLAPFCLFSLKRQVIAVDLPLSWPFFRHLRPMQWFLAQFWSVSQQSDANAVVSSLFQPRRSPFQAGYNGS